MGIRSTLISMDADIDIDALKKGDAQAFKSLVDLFQDRVYHTCFGFLGNHVEAEDAAQDTFIAVFSSIKSFRGESALSTWIYRIAVVTALQAIRRKRRKRQLALFFPGGKNDDALASIPDPDANAHPLLQLENKEKAEALFAAMSKLTEPQRVAFTLHKVDGMEYREIAQIMNVSLSSVESLIHRAKGNLQKSLSAFYRRQQ
jgi:RNA polymerase sigma factor (sigma-70 family)